MYSSCFLNESENICFIERTRSESTFFSSLAWVWLLNHALPLNFYFDWLNDWLIFSFTRPHYVPQAGPTPAVVPPQASSWWDRSMHHHAGSTLSFPDFSHYFSSSDSTWQPAEWPQHRLCSLLSSSASERTHTGVSLLMLHMPLCSTATPEISNLGDALATNSCPCVSQLHIASPLCTLSRPSCPLASLFWSLLLAYSACIDLPVA